MKASLFSIIAAAVLFTSTASLAAGPFDHRTATTTTTAKTTATTAATTYRPRSGPAGKPPTATTAAAKP